ncbi:MAG TPA: TonB-dependent receptor [Lacibacter sp.]|nr:TonB-dependent receptor [Lacibacter sp.]HMO88697.1 TonB-dependent receptor [Lacibacter sp.]
MRNQIFFTVLFLLAYGGAAAQTVTDTVPGELGEVVVRAFEHNRQLRDVPASVSHISAAQLSRFNNTSLVPALNLQPGIRMEERSPGSYRLNIRGSSLRSPFGVRNVKVYLNDIPFSEPGGSTYLNLLGFYNIHSVEVLRGPAGSLYGAGNGGTVLLQTLGQEAAPAAGLSLNGGSFGLSQLNAFVRWGETGSSNQVSYNRMRSDGYRDWTQMQRDVISWDSRINLGQRQTVRTYALYADLRYQTPGGLSPAEYAANPRQARPAAGVFPGSAQANASLNQQTIFTGISHTYTFSENFSNTTSLYGAFSRFANPTIRNFERRSEPHAGGRTVFSYKRSAGTGSLHLLAGAELQRGWYNIRNYANSGGNSGALQTEDEVNPFTGTLFTQAELGLQGGWLLTAGASLNRNRIEIIRNNQVPVIPRTRTYDNELAPRLAVLKKISSNLRVFASVAKGFSPPTSAEVLPSTGVISTDLNAEEGWNYEAGLRWNYRQRLFTELTLFYFGLQQTIVQRRDGSGADYFTNAGSTRQQGAESQVRYVIPFPSASFLNQATLWVNHTWHRFRYRAFKQVNNDYSGNRLPGVPEHTLAAGADLRFRPGLSLHLSYLFNDATPLNDANSFRASAFHLVAARLNYRVVVRNRWMMECFVSGDNLLNQTYSLGNDINAAANRFFNVAPGRNGSLGLAVTWGKH